MEQTFYKYYQQKIYMIYMFINHLLIKVIKE